MHLSITPDDLRPIVEQVTQEVVAMLGIAREMAGEQDAYTEQELAVRLQVPRHTIRDERLRGRLRGVKVGRQIRYLRSDVVEYLRRQSFTGARPGGEDAK